MILDADIYTMLALCAAGCCVWLAHRLAGWIARQ